MPLNNISLINTTVLPNFNEISPQANVRFSLERGNRNYILGTGNKSYSCRERPFVLSNYSVVFPALKRSEYDELMSYIDAVKHSIQFFAFNDFSDNYLLKWGRENVTQGGVLIAIAGGDPANPVYQICKRYTVGQQFSYKPIYYIPDEAELEINGAISLLGDLNVDRKTGQVFNQGVGLNNVPVECDLYYTLVRIVGDVNIDHYYSEGLENEGLDPSNDLTDDQILTVSFNLQEVRINQVLDYSNMTADPELQTMTKIDFDCYVNQSSRNEMRYVNSFEHNGFYASEDPDNSIETVELTVPSRVVKHKDLIYWLTMFKACCGTSFNIGN